MIVLCSNLNPLQRTVAMVRIAIVVCAACLAIVHAQTTTPAAQLQYSTLTGSGNTIVVTRVPVSNSAGTTLYQDITLQFDIDSDGNLTITGGYPVIVPSPSLQVGSFKPGKYVGQVSNGGGKGFITVNGPGLASGGTTTWSSITTLDADPCTYPGSATWYVGPIENNPQAARLKKAGIASTAWSYGVGGGSNVYVGLCTDTNKINNTYSVANQWRPGSIIGVSQSGNIITIASFTSSACTGCSISDSSAPVDQVSFLLVPDQSK